MRFSYQKKGKLFRLFSSKAGEIAYIVFEIRGLQFQIESPSIHMDTNRVWIIICPILFKVAFSFPWFKKERVNYKLDNYVDGSMFGFNFVEDSVLIYYGQRTGSFKTDRLKMIYMPWAWRFQSHNDHYAIETYQYKYILENGEVQWCLATIQQNTNEYIRRWIPWKKTINYIDILFDKEIGEGVGTYKGGTTGCSYQMLDDEIPFITLRRMERERKFK